MICLHASWETTAVRVLTTDAPGVYEPVETIVMLHASPCHSFFWSKPERWRNLVHHQSRAFKGISNLFIRRVYWGPPSTRDHRALGVPFWWRAVAARFRRWFTSRCRHFSSSCKLQKMFGVFIPILNTLLCDDVNEAECVLFSVHARDLNFNYNFEPFTESSESSSLLPISPLW